MAALNQEIFIGPDLDDPLFYFDKDHIEAPVSMQSVDLIEKELSIDTFTPIVYYEGNDYTTLRTLPFGTPVWYYVNDILQYKYYIDKIVRQSKTAFKLNCISQIGLLDKNYHVGGVYNGRSFKSLVRELISRKITETPPDSGSITYRGVTVESNNELVTLNGTATGSFSFNFGESRPFLTAISASGFYSNCAYNLPLIAGHTYQMRLKFKSGTMEKDGTTYTPTSTFTNETGFFRAILLKTSGTSWSDYWVRTKWLGLTDSDPAVVNASTSAGAVGYVYSGVTFNDAVFEVYLEDLDEIPYTMDEDVAATKIFGWLPYDTKRNNLHQIMFAENISIVKNEEGNVHFTYLKPSDTVPVISQDNIFVGGEIEYPAVATQLYLSEHSYQDVDTIETVTLLDNSDQVPVTNRLYLFDQAPIVVDSIVASDGLEVVDKGVNYAIVSGQGVLTGRPYFDKVSAIERTYNNGGEQYTVSVNDATLVTGTNSENVADRLISYYTTSEKVTADVKVTSEKCGRIYQFIDMFDNTIQAFLTKMTSTFSSFIKSACEFISGYVPNTFGNNYDYWAAVTGTGTIEIQEGTKIARFVIIGGGDGGSSGLKGIDDFDDLQAGSVGGEGGYGGNGGKILEIILRNPTPGVYSCVAGAGGLGGAECISTEGRNLGMPGEPSTVTTPAGTVYSSSDAGSYLSPNGIKNFFTNDVYACKGRNGCKGGNGGRGSVSGNGETGEDVVWDGITYRGGQGGKGLKFQFTHVTQTITNGGAGGWGAQPYYHGQNGGSVSIIDYYDDTATSSGYQAYEHGHFDQASPASTVRPSEVRQTQNYGEGGDGGHGGAGRGGFGSANDYYQSSTDPTTNKKLFLNMILSGYNYLTFQSSNGGAGNNGKKGIVLCYADKELFF